MTPHTTRGSRATTKGATGPKPRVSAPTLEMMPARMARMPFQKVVTEKVIPIHSEGKPCLSECSYTYQDSKVEKSIEVAMPPNILPVNSHQKFGESFVRQHQRNPEKRFKLPTFYVMETMLSLDI